MSLGASMASELVALGAGSAPRRSAVGSLLALPVADAVAMLVCFAAGGLINFSYENVTEEREQMERLAAEVIPQLR